MDFGYALLHIKAGNKATRTSWTQGEFVFLVPGSTFQVNRPPLSTIYPEGTEINYHGHIDRRLADGRIMPWTPQQEDLLADDWSVT